ncbi:dimethylallyl tryptophan synthase GliD1 [Biscogniauxia marginata]|nr:dimethylallyl tryptophan synthase GliD1 [Biscogniauxia marginata]
MDSLAEKQPSQVWASVSKWLPPRNPGCDYWWQLTGPHLAAWTHLAGYSTDRQYEALLFYYHWIVPSLGPAPNPNGALTWRCIPLGDDGTPIEYSWKWNTAGGEPEIRYAIEGINELSGGDFDPLNQQATRLLLHRLRSADPSVDLSLVDHFIATLFDHDNSKYAQEAASRTTMMMAHELPSSGHRFKTYFMPRKLGQTEPVVPLELWEEALVKLDPANEARAMLWDFLRNNPEGKLLEPFMVGVDNSAASSQSRIKLYFQTPHTSFESVREVMTLGGRVEVPEPRLHDLRDLILSALSLPADYPADAELPRPIYNTSTDNFLDLSVLLKGSMYYFDIAVGARVPGIKYYALVRRYGRNDLRISRGVTSWMESKGRGAYCQRYLAALECIAQHRPMDKGTGMQTYVSCMFKPSGDMEITSYVSPEAFHPTRLMVSNGHK